MYGRHGQGTTFGLEGKKLSGANANFAKIAEQMKAKKEGMAKKMKHDPTKIHYTNHS